MYSLGLHLHDCIMRLHMCINVHVHVYIFIIFFKTFFFIWELQNNNSLLYKAINKGQFYLCELLHKEQFYLCELLHKEQFVH